MIKYKINTMPKSEDKFISLMAENEIEKVYNYHKSFPDYKETPLVKLENMAECLGVGAIYIKDESYRFGLNAFKVLGSSYAAARFIGERLNKDITELPFNVLVSDEIKNALGDITFYTATDGNHGRGVAWTARCLKQRAVVYMPKGTTQTRLNNILAEGAEAEIKEYNYDECVRQISKIAEKSDNGVMIQDTAWKGYEKIPSWIMQGYGTMAKEADMQVKLADGTVPTHIFIQAGVGSLAGAIQGYFANMYPENTPKVVVVESETAACLYESAKANDGSIRTVGGDMKTIMAGLACGEPCTISWDILRNHAAAFLTVDDETTAIGMRMLASPLKGDMPVTSGESGAAAFSAFQEIMLCDYYSKLRNKLGIDKTSRILFFSTEGDTDPKRYKSIVWNGNNN